MCGGADCRRFGWSFWVVWMSREGGIDGTGATGLGVGVRRRDGAVAWVLICAQMKCAAGGGGYLIEEKKVGMKRALLRKDDVRVNKKGHGTRRTPCAVPFSLNVLPSLSPAPARPPP